MDEVKNTRSRTQKKRQAPGCLDRAVASHLLSQDPGRPEPEGETPLCKRVCGGQEGRGGGCIWVSLLSISLHNFSSTSCPARGASERGGFCSEGWGCGPRSGGPGGGEDVRWRQNGRSACPARIAASAAQSQRHVSAASPGDLKSGVSRGRRRPGFIFCNFSF